MTPCWRRTTAGRRSESTPLVLFPLFFYSGNIAPSFFFSRPFLTTSLAFLPEDEDKGAGSPFTNDPSLLRRRQGREDCGRRGRGRPRPGKSVGRRPPKRVVDAAHSEMGTAARDGSPPSPPLFPVVGTSGRTSGSSSGSRLDVSEETESEEEAGAGGSGGGGGGGGGNVRGRRLGGGRRF